MKNNNGFITLDFLVALVISMGFFNILFALSYTLVVIEISQYAIFSTTRVFIGSNLNYLEQEKAAKDKYKSLVLGPKSPFGGVFSNGWFQLSKEQQLDIRGGHTGNHRDFFDSFGKGNVRNYYTGISTFLTASILNINLPFMGSTASDDGPSEFRTRLNALLIRESSWQECMDFLRERGAELQNLPSGKKFGSKISPAYLESYKSMEDNGC